MTKLQLLRDLGDRCVTCRKCAIGGQCVYTKDRPDMCFRSNVIAEANLKAEVMVIGQNPGAKEVVGGKPFIGPSGLFFDEALREYVGIDRRSLYVTNVIKCYTPENRSPTEEEVDNCSEFLDAEIDIVKPKLIVTLGNPSLKRITGMNGITKLRGKIIVSPRYHVRVFPVYHPSPFNTKRDGMREQFIEDMRMLKTLIVESKNW